ncbi:MAG: hypothetical protein F4X72_14720 [Dehalococcoidia bacterium]|nr:hypothetical protein [Dehalococcoidia bacterium]
MLRRRVIRVVSITQHADDTPAGKLLEAIIESVDEFYSANLIWGAKARSKAEPVRVEKAFPSIVSRAKFDRVNALMRSRAPKKTHPRRVASTYLLSGLLKCRLCKRAFSGQEAKSGQFAHYVCQSIMKRGKDACEAPRLNARRFEEMVLERVRANVRGHRLRPRKGRGGGDGRRGTGAAQEAPDHRVRDRGGEEEAGPRLVRHRDDRSGRGRRRRPHQGTPRTPATSGRRRRRCQGHHLPAQDDQDDVDAVAALAQDLREFLGEGDMRERRAFVGNFVKEIAVRPGLVLLRYTIPIPMPEGSSVAGRNIEELVLDGSVVSGR